MFMLKAIVAGIITAAGSIGAAASDGHVTLTEICIAVGATAVAVGGVFGVSNTPPK